jgi:hypothetical protein
MHDVEVLVTGYLDYTHNNIVGEVAARARRHDKMTVLLSPANFKNVFTGAGGKIGYGKNCSDLRILF